MTDRPSSAIKLLGIDIGTSGCKVLLIDGEGRILKQASAEYPLLVPQPMWTEQNPEDWWTGVLSCLQEINEPHPDAIGVTGQMHGSVFLDENKEVVRPALLWNDQRTSAECEQIENAVGPTRLREITCNPMLTGFQVPKLIWLRNHEPENYARVKTMLLPKDYIRFKLTGEMVTEVSDASGTGLLDVPNRVWSTEIFDALGLNVSILPKVVESSEVTGMTKSVSGLADGIPVVGGGGDQAAAAVGTGAVVPGVISVSLGTSGVVFTSIPSPEFDARGAAHTFCHANGSWHAMGVMLSCGGALRWYRDTIRPDATYDEIAESAASVEAGAEGLTFLPYLTGERCPHNDPFARATFSGVTLSHTRAHFDRAVFEGLTLGLLDGFLLLKKLGASAETVRITSGGAKSKFWVQMIADAFNSTCQTLEIDEGPAFGSAILAGVGIGVWPDVETATKLVIRVKNETLPGSTSYSSAYDRFSRLYLATRDWNHVPG